MTTQPPSIFMCYPAAADAKGAITKIRELLEQELTLLTGHPDFKIGANDDIGIGQDRREWVQAVLDHTHLLVPIIQPLFFTTENCRETLARFLEREANLGRNDLVLPIYYIEFSELREDSPDPLMRTIAARHLEDWRKLRHADSKTLEEAVTRLAGRLHTAIQRTATKPASAAGAAATRPAATASSTMAAPVTTASKPVALQELVDLLLKLFSADEFMRFLRFGQATAEIVPHLPTGPVPPVTLFSEAVLVLWRNDLIDDEFFARLVTERGRRAQEIRRVQAKFGS